MLTKDLLNYRTRNGRIYPQLVRPTDEPLLDVAAGLIDLFKQAPGRTHGELAEMVSESPWADHPRLPGLRKLLLDRCEEKEDDGAIAERRLQVLKSAESLRCQGEFTSLAAFQMAVATQHGTDPRSLQDGLYSDLAENRLLQAFAPLEPEALLHRYNCAQIQGLLIHARVVSLEMGQTPLGIKRAFFRCLKFQRLLAEIHGVHPAPKSAATKGETTTLTLSGPLQIFQNTQAYGLRLATFFPYILHLPRWSLNAELKLNGNRLDLSVDDEIGIASHYKELSPFVPSELTAFMAAFNAKGGDWRAELGSDYVHVGRQSYCFPDVTLTSCQRQVVHAEFFHRWHAGQLPGRLAALAAHDPGNLILGISDELAGMPEVSPLIEASAWMQRHGFRFKSMPTPKQLHNVLVRHQAGASHLAAAQGPVDLDGFWNAAGTSGAQ